MSDPIVPANGEIFIWTEYVEGAEEDEDPFAVSQCPIIAWRVIVAGKDKTETWGEPVLPQHVEVPWSSSGLVTAIMVPSGKIFSDSGSEQFDTVEAFSERWRRFYEVRRERDRDDPKAKD